VNNKCIGLQILFIEYEKNIRDTAEQREQECVIQIHRQQANEVRNFAFYSRDTKHNPVKALAKTIP
jgi:hypothetical protein